MIRKSHLSFAALATLAMLATLAAPALADAANPTVDELIAKNIEAKGGRAKLDAVQAMRMTGKMTMGPGMEAPFVREAARPAKLRQEFTLQGMTAVQTLDGEAGWSLMPFLGKKEAEPMAADELKEMVDQADIDGPLVDYKTKGHQVELVGKEDIEGSPAYKLKVTKKNGDIENIFLDAETFLEIKQMSKKTIRGQEVELEMTFGDYKEVGGVLYPHSLQQKAKGAPGGGEMAITIESIEVNPQLAADRFGKPAGAAAPAAKP